MSQHPMVLCVSCKRQPRTHLCWFYPLAHYQGEEDTPLYGFDIAQETREVYGGATLNCQVLAALQCRAETDMDTNKRKEHPQQRKASVADLQTDAVEKARSTAWGLSAQKTSAGSKTQSVGATLQTKC